MSLLHLFGQSIFGFVIGSIAKFLVFTDNSNDWIIHGLIGTFGAIGGTRLVRMIFGVDNNKASWILAFLSSIVMLAIFYFVRNYISHEETRNVIRFLQLKTRHGKTRIKQILADV